MWVFIRNLSQKLFHNKVLVILVVLILGVLIYLYYPRNIIPKFITVSRGDVIQIVNINGKVISAKEIDLQFSTPGIISKIFKNVGDNVKKGTILVSLENQELLAKRREAQAIFNQAKTKLERILKGPTKEELDAAIQAVENAKIAVKDAENNFMNNTENSWIAYLNSLKAAIVNASIALEKNKDVINDPEGRETLNAADSALFYQALFSNDNAKVSFDTAKQAVDAANLDKTNDKIDTAYDKVNTHLQDLQKALDDTFAALSKVSPDKKIKGVPVYSIKDEINKQRVNIVQTYTSVISSKQNVINVKLLGESNINSARSALAQAEAQLNILKAAPTKEFLDLANLDIQKALAGLDFVQEQLKKTYLIAPYNGIIGKINVKINEFVMAGQPILSFINLNNFQIESEVSEVDVGKLKVDQLAIITFDTIPQNQWEGRVIKIDLSPKLTQGAIYYKVIVSFDNFDERVKPGMTANLNIQTEKRENVINIPQATVIERGNKYFVKILEDEQIKEREIKLGLFGVENVEVLEGLKEGDKITFAVQ